MLIPFRISFKNAVGPLEERSRAQRLEPSKRSSLVSGISSTTIAVTLELRRKVSGMTTQRPGGLSVIEQLASYVATEAFDKLPEAAVATARRAILDTLGVTLAGAAEPTAARVRALISHRRGADEATVIGTEQRASVEDAALANG